MNVLALGAHPDDVEFGCGGTLIKYAAGGHHVYLMLATAGGIGGDTRTRRMEAERAAELMGVEEIIWCLYRDTELPLGKQLIRDIEVAIERVRPAFIFVHYEGDTHQDHRVLAQASASATRHIGNVLFYEGPSSTGFNPSVFVDISEQLEAKLLALGAHVSQLGKTNVAGASIIDVARANAVTRGIQARRRCAEGFVPMRLLINVEPHAGHGGAA